MSIGVILDLDSIEPARITAVDLSNNLSSDLVSTRIGDDLGILGTLDQQLVMVDRVRDALLRIQAEREALTAVASSWERLS